MNLAITEPYVVIPAKAGIQGPKPQRLPWTPAFAGVTGNAFIGLALFRARHSHSKES
jgi:hypothetical protein